MTIRSQAGRLIVAVMIAVLSLAGCADRTLRTTRLDSNGLTVVTLNEPVILTLPAAHRLAAAAHDYAYLGPVEINRMGERRYFVWVGLGSTIDRALIDVSPPGAESMALLIDGHPVKLPLHEWNKSLDNPPYQTTAPLYATLSAHASLNQIRMIANASTVEVLFVTAAGDVLRYRKWEGDWNSWSLLVAAE